MFLALLLASVTLAGSAGSHRVGRSPMAMMVEQRRSGAPSAYVTNPTSHARLAVWLLTPSGAGPFPALVMVPGGLHGSRTMMKDVELASFLDKGIALVLFDPDGRGRSGGTEDMGGTVQQDGLAAVLAWAKARPEIDAARLGVLTLSYGITMGAGTLARYPHAARFLIDWEGPADRTFDRCSTLKAPRPDGMPWGACDDDEWWRWREAARSIKLVRVPYLRVEFKRPHGRGDNIGAAVAMVQAARAGGVPWVRVNSGQVNADVRSRSDLRLLDNDRIRRGQALSAYALEMIRMVARDGAG